MTLGDASIVARDAIALALEIVSVYGRISRERKNWGHPQQIVLSSQAYSGSEALLVKLAQKPAPHPSGRRSQTTADNDKQHSILQAA